MTEAMTGGCQCGRIRYSVAIENDDAYLCHCRMCQRATGGVSIAFKNVKIANVTWEREPDRYRSSPIAQRGFCSACGTPLTFEFLEPGETMDLTVGSFDEPGRFVPRHHFSPETWHAAWLDTKDLPTTRVADNPSTADRWIKALGKLPD
ncbi:MULTISPECIES: GFA family protein [unclassified Sphingomonas]|uniref:GFA family protein n=1 Tax=unclassified Sphingomonas TaxID=196159 RepID=UPI001F5AE390|nr:MULTISPECIES: GFA family protein [unclassified Sphingomonas]